MNFTEVIHSTKYLILVLVFTIFAGEILVMFFINELPPLSEWNEALLDSALLSLLIFPALHFLSFKPLLNEINKHKQTEHELFIINCSLREHEKEQEEKNYELKRINAALADANERYDHLFNFSPVGYLVLDDNSVITEINQTGETLFGTNKANILNRNLISFMPPEEIEHWHTFHQNTLENTDKQSCKLIIKRDDGSVFYALLDCRRDDPLLSSNIRVSFTDITKQQWATF